MLTVNATVGCTVACDAQATELDVCKICRLPLPYNTNNSHTTADDKSINECFIYTPIPRINSVQ